MHPGSKILWAKDADGEIGKRPTPEPHLWEVSAEAYCAMHEALAAQNAREKKK